MRQGRPAVRAESGQGRLRLIERSLTRLTVLTFLNMALVVAILANQIAMVIRFHGIDTELSTLNDSIAVSAK
jgi:hypothetical protein